MSERWAGFSPEDVDQLAVNYAPTVEKVRELADEKYSDDPHDAHQLYQRAPQNVRNALFRDLKERGCPPEEIEGCLRTILQAAGTQAGEGSDSC
jgi:hypothetical protein